MTKNISGLPRDVEVEVLIGNNVVLPIDEMGRVAIARPGFVLLKVVIGLGVVGRCFYVNQDVVAASSKQHPKFGRIYKRTVKISASQGVWSVDVTANNIWMVIRDSETFPLVYVISLEVEDKNKLFIRCVKQTEFKSTGLMMDIFALLPPLLNSED